MSAANSLLLGAINTPYKTINVCQIWSSHGTENEDWSLMACVAMKCGGVVRKVWGKTIVLNQYSTFTSTYYL